MTYKYFSNIYDKIYNNNKYFILADKFTPYLRENAKLLDLACGTGTFLFGMHEKGWQISGLDLSPEMLAIAKEKFNSNKIDCNLYCQNMENFNIHKKFDLITCNFDSLNYILSLEKLKKVFENVNNNLTEKGMFTFDVITEYQAITFNKSSNRDYNDFRLKTNSKYNALKKEKNIKITIEYDNQQFCEEHIQKIFDLADINNLLLSTGFEISNLVDIEAKSMPEVTKKTTRAYYVANKVK